MAAAPCRLSFGGNPPYGSEKRAPTTIQWILHRNDTGAPLVLPDDAGEITVRADGRFDGAALAIELSHDGMAFASAAAPIWSPGQQRLTVRPKMLRPAVVGGGEFTAVVVTLTAQLVA
jgi:hypothetical protein